MKKLNILINGFSRIGRALLGQISKKNHISKIYINNLNEDTTNLIYTYNFNKLAQVYKKFLKIVLKKDCYYLCTEKNFNKIDNENKSC